MIRTGNCPENPNRYSNVLSPKPLGDFLGDGALRRHFRRDSMRIPPKKDRMHVVWRPVAPHDPDDYVFTDPTGVPPSQEWLHKRVWLPTLKRAGLRRRGQYSIRDTFVSIALSAGEDPGWVAQVCGTSEEMIFRHYRSWIPGLNPESGRKISRVLESIGGGNGPPDSSPIASPTPRSPPDAQRNQLLKKMEAGGIEPPSEGASTSESTCVACDLISPRLLPQAGSRAASRRSVSAPAPPALTGAQPEVWRLSPPYGRRQVKRRGLIRQRVRSYRLQLSSPARFDEVNRNPDTHLSLPHPRRTQIAPSRRRASI